MFKDILYDANARNSILFGINTPADAVKAATGVFEDLMKAGVIDPTEVARTALFNAAPVAALMLTTEALIIQHPVIDQGSASAGMQAEWET